MGIILETERLLLRELEADDAQALAGVLSDPVAMQWYPRAFSRAEVEHWIERNRTRYRKDGHGLWAMLLKASGELIGDCGLVTQEVDGEQLMEVAYHVRRDQWGQGFATEGARACMEHAFTKLGAEQVISLIRPENTPSWRVAEKNGLRVWKETTRAMLRHHVYLLTKDEWQKRAPGTARP